MNRLERHLTSTTGHTFAPYRQLPHVDRQRVGNALRQQLPRSFRAIAAANLDRASRILAACALARTAQSASWAQVDAYRARMREAREHLAIARKHLAFDNLCGGLPL